MKNITLSVDDKTHRTARLVAAGRGVSLSALVRELLNDLPPVTNPRQIAVQESIAAMDVVKKFSASNRMSREEVHER